MELGMFLVVLLFFNFANIMPDEPLYGLKLFSEDLEAAFVFDIDEKEKIIEKHRDTRLIEEQTLKSANKQIPDSFIEAKNKDIEEFEKIQIKRIVTDFNNCLKMENIYEETKCVEDVNDRANALKITSENCPNGVNVFVIRIAEDRFKELQNQCPGISAWDYVDAKTFILSN